MATHQDPLLPPETTTPLARRAARGSLQLVRQVSGFVAEEVQEVYRLEQKQPWHVRLTISSACMGIIGFSIFTAASFFLAPYLRVVPSYVTIPELGDVEGTWYPMARVFKGIPFGRADRFQPPEMAPPWKPEVLLAREYKPACMHPSGYRREGVSEDCLYLNVFTPTWGTGDKPNPVLFWLHGGGYTLGAASDTAPEDLTSFVWTHQVVVVSTNYRLGVFGFSGSNHLRAKDNSTGNFGIQDQRLALEWVRRYIRPFGGDPTWVTVIGWSAGAASISVHLSAPKSRRIFQGAIMMSGGFTDWAALPMSAAEWAFQSVAKCLGCAEEDRQCLLSKSSEEVMRCGQGQWYGPVVDGVELPKNPFKAIQEGDPVIDYSVPIIVGNTLADKLVDIGRHADSGRLRQLVEKEVGAHYGKDAVDQALGLYELTIFRDYAQDIFPHQWSPAYWAARVMFADREFTCVSRNVSEQWRRQGGIAFWYSWVQPQVFSKSIFRSLQRASDRNAKKPLGASCYPCPGAGHGADLAFLFENPSKIDVEGKVVQGDMLTDNVQSLYVNFIWAKDNFTRSTMAEGRPEAGTSLLDTPLPAWHRFNSLAGNAMQFVAGNSRQVDHYRKAECEFWDAHPKVPR